MNLNHKFVRTVEFSTGSCLIQLISSLFLLFLVGNSCVRGQTTTATAAMLFFYMCAYVSHPVWRKAIEDGFSFTFVVWCLPFTASDGHSGATFSVAEARDGNSAAYAAAGCCRQYGTQDFEKGEGARNFGKFEKNKDQSVNCFTQNQSDFLPTIR